MNQVVIIGGGVAGLSAAIHCVENGKQVLVIEGGDYSMQKVCGEFISAESLPMLERWGIVPPVMLQSMKIAAAHAVMTLKFPNPAGSMARYALEHALVVYARKIGVDVRTKTLVRGVRLLAHDGYTIECETGDVIAAQHLVTGTGRVAQMLDPKNIIEPDYPYVGMKAHFKASMPNEVQFFVFPGAYFGVSPVAEGVVNIACLAKKELLERAGSAQALMNQFVQLPHAQPVQAIMREPLFNWVGCKVPEFGVRAFRGTGQSYLIGDAAMVVPPCTGAGITLGLFSGQAVADAIKMGDRKIFDGSWKQDNKRVVFWGRVLHVLLTRPLLTSIALCLGSKISKLGILFLKKTRC